MDHLVLRLEGGIASHQKFEFRDDDSTTRTYDGDLKDTGYAGISAAYQY